MDVDVKFETVFDTIGELQTEGQQLDERLADVRQRRSRCERNSNGIYQSHARLMEERKNLSVRAQIIRSDVEQAQTMLNMYRDSSNKSKVSVDDLQSQLSEEKARQKDDYQDLDQALDELCDSLKLLKHSYHVEELKADAQRLRDERINAEKQLQELEDVLQQISTRFMNCQNQETGDLDGVPPDEQLYIQYVLSLERMELQSQLALIQDELDRMRGSALDVGPDMSMNVD